MTEQKRRAKLRDRAAERILEIVISGNLSPGDRLALNLLEARGLLRIEHGRGAVVSDGDTNAVKDALGMLLRVQSRAMGELLEIRKILEVEIAALAAERADAEDIRTMREALGRMRELIHVSEGYVDADVDFHSLLAASARNGVLLQMMEPIVGLLKASRRVSASLPGAAQRALREHEAILDRVAAGDADGARAEMRIHIESTAGDIEWATGVQPTEEEARREAPEAE
jgi:GntR family transcriptional repressor for pyruvate dehydrogenase complex